MLVEKSSFDDMRAFRRKAVAKYEQCKNGWLGREIDKHMLKCKKGPKEILKRQFKIDGQDVYVEIIPIYNHLGRIQKHYGFTLLTHVETKRGKLTFYFFLNSDEIVICTPHCTSRLNERASQLIDYRVITSGTIIPYTRDNKEYELRINENSVQIQKKLAPDITMAITFLPKDMCTGKHYQAMFKIAERDIPELNELIAKTDIYEWK